MRKTRSSIELGVKKEIPERKGTYILLINVKRNLDLHIGSLGRKNIPWGKYAYIGSAFGKGGLKTRILRHLKKEKKKRWHIDYLTTNPFVEVIGVILIESDLKLECVLTRKLIKNSGEAVIKKFGSTDCHCPSHFLKINEENLNNALEDFKYLTKKIFLS